MNGRPFTDVVSIGIGGSFLGPKMVSEALRPYWHDQLQCHFVANIDGSDIGDTLRHLDPETTLFLVQSKSFRTQETLANARAAREWFVENGGSQQQVSRHFVAVTAQQDEAERFGIARDNVFPMWDWVGGRYSLWSAIGLPIALAVGMDNFRSLLSGAHAMDEHFRTAPLERNMPVIMGLLGLWYSHFFAADSHAVLPYDHFLGDFPRTFNNSTWRATANRCALTARQLTIPQVRSSGAARVPTDSTPTTSSCTRERGWYPWISSCRCTPTTPWATIIGCCSPTA